MTAKGFPMKLKWLRTQRKMSQADLAAKADLSREYVARLETGHHDPPLSTLQRLAKALKVKVTKLLE